jgi:hypothetical protein
MTFTTAIATYVVYLVVSSAVNSMAPPLNARSFYAFFYRWANKLTSNVGQAIEHQYHVELPGVQPVSQLDAQVVSTADTLKE